MGMFDLGNLRQPPEAFLDSLDRSFFAIPRRWDSAIGEETLDLLENLLDGEFVKCRHWKDPKWRQMSIPRLNWPQIAELFNICAKYVLELETYGIYFRKEGERYTLKQFMVQDWKDPAHPWSVFMLCCFGTLPQGRSPIDPSRKAVAFMAMLRPGFRKPMQEERFTICDSIFEDE